MPDPRLLPPPGGLIEVMRENARKLVDIRRICGKVAVIRNMGQQPAGVLSLRAVAHLDVSASSTVETARIR
jgi:hypothetical protein